MEAVELQKKDIEKIDMCNYIKETTNENDKILVIGNKNEI